MGQFYFLLFASLVVSILLFFNKKHSNLNIAKEKPQHTLGNLHGNGYLVLKLLIFVLIGYGEGEYLGIEFTLLTLLIIEVSAYYHLTNSILLNLFIIIGTILNQQEIKAWNTEHLEANLQDLLSLVLYSTLIGIFSIALRYTVRTLNAEIQITHRLDNAISQLIDANMGYQQLVETARDDSAFHERRRIARDIHDTVVHNLVNINMLAEKGIVLNSSAKSDLETVLNLIVTQAKDAISQVRHDLRELNLLQNKPYTGLKSFYRLVNVYQEATGVQVNLHTYNIPWEFNEKYSMVLYKLIQEGLTNAFRHGKATKVDIRLWIYKSGSILKLKVRIQDNGQGGSVFQKGIGIQGMEERLKLYKGIIETKNISVGFVITATIPIDQSFDIR